MTIRIGIPALAILGALVLTLAFASVARADCTPVGRIAPNLHSVATPDFSARLSATQSKRLPGDALDYSDYSAYDARGRGAQQFECTSRNGADRWLLWRSKGGRSLATFDGIEFHAARTVIVAAWRD